MIKINGKNIEISSTTILDYPKKEQYKPDRVAVEVNGSIVKKMDYEKYILNDGDKVEIVCFVGGG